ncbi:helix-turn-helix domain-containing protein [Galbibacter sp. BG1]
MSVINKDIIRKCRELLNLNQEDFGKLLGGFHISSVQKWESGERNMSKRAREKLEEVIDLNTLKVKKLEITDMVETPTYFDKFIDISDRELITYITYNYERLKKYPEFENLIKIDAAEIAMQKMIAFSKDLP